MSLTFQSEFALIAKASEVISDVHAPLSIVGELEISNLKPEFRVALAHRVLFRGRTQHRVVVKPFCRARNGLVVDWNKEIRNEGRVGFDISGFFIYLKAYF